MSRTVVVSAPYSRGLRVARSLAAEYHACGYRALPIALELAVAARTAGRAGRVVYDAIDIALESNTFNLAPSGPEEALPRGWARRADAMVTANEAFADDWIGDQHHGSPARAGGVSHRPG